MFAVIIPINYFYVKTILGCKSLNLCSCSGVADYATGTGFERPRGSQQHRAEQLPTGNNYA